MAWASAVSSAALADPVVLENREAPVALADQDLVAAVVLVRA